ncbi:MAG TPA: RpiB/LacA/LacB family sugar-phosphate isomerase [Patescibacteria group bacterium]|nr:RpiB/LacA/LacB family sugar-phosphate isomerase [Patescibacteria group bacterium]
MKIYIAGDHAGYWLRESLKEDLRSWGHEVEDLGNLKYDQGDDYPDFIIPLAEKVAKDPRSLGVVIGRWGNGEAIAANKVKGIRAALCLTEEMAKKAREDNDANILALGSQFVDENRAEKVVGVFIDTPFPEEERHQRRIDKILSYEASRD